MNILVLGVSGMIGRTMFRVLSLQSGWQVSGSIRSKGYEGAALGNVFTDIDLINSDHLVKLFNKAKQSKAKPDVVINCTGLSKHFPDLCDASIVIGYFQRIACYAK